MSKWSIFALCIVAAVGIWFFSKGSCPLSAMGQGQVTEIKNPRYQKITAQQVKERLDKGNKLFIVDVRTKEEYAEGHVPGSYLIPYDEIETQVAQLPQKKNTDVVVYCRSGRRSEIAAKSLISLGYTNVADMGAVSNWTYGLEK